MTFKEQLELAVEDQWDRVHSEGIRPHFKGIYEAGAKWALTSDVVRELVKSARCIADCNSPIRPKFKVLHQALAAFDEAVKEME